MSKKLIDDTDYWGLDKEFNISFKPNEDNSIISILVNDKSIGSLMKIADRDGDLGVALHLNHLVDSVSGMEAMFIPVNNHVIEYIDIIFRGAEKLKWEETYDSLQNW